MIIKRVSETYELIAKEIMNNGECDGMSETDIIKRTTFLVTAAKDELAEEMRPVDVTIRGVEDVIMNGWRVDDLSAVSRITTYVMMLSHSLCTQEDVLIDVKKGRVKL